MTKNLTFEFAVSTMFDRDENNGTSIESMRGWLSPWTRLTDDEGNFVHVATSQTVYEPLLMSGNIMQEKLRRTGRTILLPTGNTRITIRKR